MSFEDEDLKFQREKCLMADVLKLKINERLNVEEPDLRATKIGNECWENWFVYIKGQIWKLAKLRAVRYIEWTDNSKIVNFWSPVLVSEIEKYLENF